MPAAMYADQGNLLRVDLLQGFAVTDGNQPVFGAMNDIGMTFYFGYPLICPQMKTQIQYERVSMGRNRSITFRKLK